jgi:riboflavin biosynthesis pyrimidine reductase
MPLHGSTIGDHATPMPLRRLFPDPADVEAETLFDDIDFAALAPPDRPYVVVNMVASADGRATLDGRTEKLGNEADHAIFHALRTTVDAVMVGTGTLRTERYGRMVRNERRQEIRRARGLDPEPLSIVSSRSGHFPDDIPLFNDPEARVFTHTGASAAEALRRAQEEHDVRSVLCEGGPTLNAAMLAEGVFDELFLTVSPLLAGGAAPLTILTEGDPTPLELRWVLEGDGALFLRYAVAGSG